jgi:solute carrier family 30 (zinc transporter), member 9
MFLMSRWRTCSHGQDSKFRSDTKSAIAKHLHNGRPSLARVSSAMWVVGSRCRVSCAAIERLRVHRLSTRIAVTRQDYKSRLIDLRVTPRLFSSLTDNGKRNDDNKQSEADKLKTGTPLDAALQKITQASVKMTLSDDPALSSKASASTSKPSTPPASSSAATKTAAASIAPPSIPRRRFKFEDDPNNRIRDVQMEKARLQTKKNVIRALGGNVAICACKFAAWMSSGSSGLWAEFIHSVVDCGNQALLLVGLRESYLSADRKHPYGYGKSVYFYALVSALGTFFLGAGVSMSHAVEEVMHPSLQTITWEVWGVLTLSFLVDGYILTKTFAEIGETKKPGVSMFNHIRQLRDPATLAILLEDGAACFGVLLAFGGILLTAATGNPIFDGVAGIGISTLLGVMGLTLVRVNHRFLLGHSVDSDILTEIEKILLSRRSIDNIRSVQSQWTGPETFSFKAEVDFDGTYLAAKLMPIYQKEFLKIKDTMDQELQILLALYAEDIMRTAEREVRYVEHLIRKRYPGAEFIELEPMSMDVDRYALDDNFMADLRRAEGDVLNNYLRSLKKEEGIELETTSKGESKGDSKGDSTGDSRKV